MFGARNLGKAIIEVLVADGWAVAGAARTDATLAGVTALGALALRADVTEPASVERALAQAVEAHGDVDLVVNAAAAYGGERRGPFGGGPVVEAELDAFDSWAAWPAGRRSRSSPPAAAFCAREKRPATVARSRAAPPDGPWPAAAVGCGSFGVRAITNAAALELREDGIQVTLLIVRTRRHRAALRTLPRHRPREALADPREIATAVAFLAGQGARAASHELVVTPLAERWVP